MAQIDSQTIWIVLIIAAIVFAGIVDSPKRINRPGSNGLRRTARVSEVRETYILARWFDPKTGKSMPVVLPRHPGRRYIQGEFIQYRHDPRHLKY